MVNSKLGIDMSEYLKHEKEISALALSNYLIELQGYSNNLFSTGRPKIYVNVVSYPEKLEKQGIIKSIKKDVSDCRYELGLDQLDEVDPEKNLSIDNKVNLKMGTQLSLFYDEIVE
ncbi:DUF3895 domain-containing protein [Metabacillus halosaccharovorans]|uniref:DUF3895 domain-containing protein n=1 Tax=Metabacillus halosaccharovorans TaxID=930124 RepID=UPI001C1FFA8E|nr:DUF3895 domain-containing protein [Metabacillus halosaccharovorans]